MFSMVQGKSYIAYNVYSVQLRVKVHGRYIEIL